MPLICIVYFLQYLDKISIGYGSVMGLRKDAHLTGDDYNWVSSIFFFGHGLRIPHCSSLAVLSVGEVCISQRDYLGSYSGLFSYLQEFCQSHGLSSLAWLCRSCYCSWLGCLHVAMVPEGRPGFQSRNLALDVWICANVWRLRRLWYRDSCWKGSSRRAQRMVDYLPLPKPIHKSHRGGILLRLAGFATYC